MSDYLPQDLLIDILTRLPAESLVRLTPVCKSWHSLITGPKFISRHLHRTASNPDNDRLLVSYRTDEPKQNHYSLVVDCKDSFRQLKTLDLPVGAFESLGYSVVDLRRDGGKEDPAEGIVCSSVAVGALGLLEFVLGVASAFAPGVSRGSRALTTVAVAVSSPTMSLSRHYHCAQSFAPSSAEVDETMIGN
ncbi:hypothetical protein RHGRI_017484 [Rhododendron griersonianum]|uniref:F-box domain-containing protein n=1 Tax=Rhododendron griersonianum TaxID=479676 RepID=A0AAV6JXY7_9ERIC|nr:hypothetical protein RHGRI_017484 [Rhododendron griersonianum]